MEATVKKINYGLSLAQALGVVVYVALVALVMNNAERIFGKMDNILLGVIAKTGAFLRPISPIFHQSFYV